MSDAANKLTNSAHQLGVMLGIPMYVDPEKGFSADKVITWENGDQIKVSVNWADGAFYFTANLGQIDPKTNEMSFISGEIANANSLESLIGMIDGFLKEKAVERGDVEQAINPDVTEPVEVAPECEEEPAINAPAAIEPVNSIGIINGFPADDEGPVEELVDADEDDLDDDEEDDFDEDDSDDEDDPVDEVLEKYKEIYTKYQDLLMDPDHDPYQIHELSNELIGLEIKLRENGINPTLIEKG